MTRAWQVPISTAKPASGIAHLFFVSPRTDFMVTTQCGMLVVPGFAKPAGKARRCKHCEAKI